MVETAGELSVYALMRFGGSTVAKLGEGGLEALRKIEGNQQPSPDVRFRRSRERFRDYAPAAVT